MKTNKVKICILDSGINTNFFTNKSQISGLHMKFENQGYSLTPDFRDSIGHGTAVTSIILNECPDAEIFCLKIFDAEMGIDGEQLIKALEYISNNISCDIVNVSAGITHITFYDQLNDVVSKLNAKNTLVISAFDNNGIISYPAAMTEVIGVDVGSGLNSWIIQEDDVIDIRIPEHYYRVKWSRPENNIIKGTSFACGEVSGIAAKLYQESGAFYNKSYFKETLRKYLRNNQYMYENISKYPVLRN